MKQALFIVLLLIAKLTFAQHEKTYAHLKSTFEGVWRDKTMHYTNTVKIKFEPGKDFATFTDIGSGVAPAKTFRASINGNLLVIQAVWEQNDYTEIEVIKGKLHLRTSKVTWDEKGNILKTANKSSAENRVFKRVSKIE